MFVIMYEVIVRTGQINPENNSGKEAPWTIEKSNTRYLRSKFIDAIKAKRILKEFSKL